MRLGPLRVYPTGRAIALAASAGILALFAEWAAPHVAIMGSVCAILVLALLAADLALGVWGADMTAQLTAPETMALGSIGRARLTVDFSRSPARIYSALETDERFSAVADQISDCSPGETLQATFELNPVRRGEAKVKRAWVRWSGPLGLLWRQRETDFDQSIFIAADMRPTRRQAVRLNACAPTGEKSQIEQGQGGEFQALRELPPGGDRRSIDWKRSARHGRLLSKEFRVERNHTVAIAFDCGRQMVEPWGDAPRIDHALSSGLALAYISLSGGDGVKLFAFDGKVRLDTGVVSGVRAFPTLERLTGSVDYSTDATNYTLGLFTLSSALPRRSLVVVFTEFPDATGAELMVAAMGRLAAKHVVIFITFRDEELEALTGASPAAPADITRAVVAQELLNARTVVIERLRRQGVKVVQAEPKTIDFSLVDAYLDVKRQELV